MKARPIKLKTFIGYQIKSAFHSPADFKLMGEALGKYLRHRSPPIELNIEVGEFPPGTRLWDEVVAKIESSQITIFDISENNPNVLLEAGISFGMAQHVVLLKCEQSTNASPSDLTSFIFLPYRSKKTFYQESFLQSIASSIDHFLANNHDTYFYHRLLWSLNPLADTYVVPGILPEKHTGNRFHDYIHIRAYSDLDAVFAITETIHRLYPRMNISAQPARTSNELPRNWQNSNLIFVGGPDFNHVVREFEDLCPLQYKYGPGKDDIWLQHKTTGTKYMPRFYIRNHERRAQDYGFFLKRNLGSSNKARMVFLGGARAWGVYGAAMLLSCTGSDKSALGYSNAKLLVERFGSDPSLLIPVEVSGSKSGIRPPILNIDSRP